MAFFVRVKDALVTGEKDIVKALGEFGKVAPEAEAASEAVVTVLAPKEAAALQTVFTAANGIVAAANTANQAGVAAVASKGADATADATFASTIKSFVADLEAGLTALGVIKKPAAPATPAA